MKPIIKEIAIMLLTLIIIVLIFGILLYDYIPMKQIEVSISKYEPSNDVKEALDEIATSETTNVILTYEVTDSDLSIYETTKSYNKGKANPFSSFSSTDTTSSTTGGVTTNNNNSSNNGTTNNNSNSTSSTNSEQSTTNTFYEKNDTK